MHTLETGITGFLDATSPESLTALRIAQNNKRFAQAVKATWADSPGSADYVLAHVNSLYIGTDEGDESHPNTEPGRKTLGVYLDEPTARAELNSRRETVAYHALLQGLSFSRIIIHYSRGGMRQRHAFPDARRRLAEEMESLGGEWGDAHRGVPSVVNAGEASLPQDTVEDTPCSKTLHDQRDLMEDFKRAVCRTLPDYYQMRGLTEALEGVYFEEAYRGKRSETATWYYCHLFTSDPVLSIIRGVIEASGLTLKSKCRDLGLNVRDFFVHASPSLLANHKAYPLNGAPRPLEPFEKKDLARLRAHYGE